MHIHGNPFEVTAASLYAAGQNQQQLNAKRALETRKRLERASEALDSDSFTAEDLMSRWTKAHDAQNNEDPTYKG